MNLDEGIGNMVPNEGEDNFAYYMELALVDSRDNGSFGYKFKYF